MKIFLASENKDKVSIIKNALEELHLNVDVMEDKESADFMFELEEYEKSYEEGNHLITKATLIDKSGDEFVGNGPEIHLYETT